MTLSSPLTVRFIAETVAEHYGVSHTELVSARRGDAVIVPRHVAMWLARLMTPLSFDEIGRNFGNRDHSTVRHAVMTVDAMLQADPGMRRELDVLRVAIVTGAAALELAATKLPGDMDPLTLARNIASGRKRAVDVTTNEITALALAVLTAHGDREEPNLPAVLMMLLAEFLAAEDIAVLAAGTEGAAIPALKRNHALAALRDAFDQFNGDKKYELAA